VLARAFIIWWIVEDLFHIITRPENENPYDRYLEPEDWSRWQRQHVIAGTPIPVFGGPWNNANRWQPIAVQRAKEECEDKHGSAGPIGASTGY
jgi:hypothetical protein